MAGNKKARTPILVTPSGVAVWPHLNKPDTKEFQGQQKAPKYHVKLRFDPNDPAWAEFKAKAEAIFAEQLEEAKAANPKYAKVMQCKNSGFRDVINDNGDLTGEMELKAAMNASYKDKTTGVEVPLKPQIVDGLKQKLDPPPAIWGGSELILAVRPGVHSAGKEYTEFFQLVAVQIKKLKTGGGGDVSSLFGEIEDGFDGTGMDGGEEGGSEGGEEAAGASDDF